MEQNTSRFDEGHWYSICEAAEADAMKRCGSVHVMFTRFFSETVDQQLALLPEEHRARALFIASDWDYTSPQEREQVQRELAKEGRCSHGLHPENCPMGCGDLPRACFADTEVP